MGSVLWQGSAFQPASIYGREPWPRAQGLITPEVMTALSQMSFLPCCRQVEGEEMTGVMLVMGLVSKGMLDTAIVGSV